MINIGVLLHNDGFARFIYFEFTHTCATLLSINQDYDVGQESIPQAVQGPCHDSGYFDAAVSSRCTFILSGME
ncbi:hypothetical protein CY34DRAFT_802212 [Suillus luteus UH-Slu-Lm8-n1]|uniref:Unplaced genomic scaffold CY34scaffold_51, whole genome shotgun sequence n=1 Tax=Suillus luteus UH-Slu-Lm8-n1 TaxID=930992 RepID=A0A0D0BNV6_9AGAM|nr:hypothetical protein CY34DRAFT_802212 [Suillus luteus UH-Slu-Lm8-n1]